MMPPSADTDIVQAIQLSISPVFLLSALGVMLNVLTSRLARIIDRRRKLEEKLEMAASEHRREIKTLRQRAWQINIAINLCVLAGILVCALVATIFVDQLFHLHSEKAIAIMFIFSMVAFTGALVFFLIEMLTATRFLRD